jgi:hypothetical protein
MIKKSHAVMFGFFVGVFAAYLLIKVAAAGYSFGQGLAQQEHKAQAKGAPPG